MATITAVDPATSRRFEQLARKWARDTRFMSDIDAIVRHPAYLEVMRLGPQVVPLILHRLEQEPDHWFHALRELTGHEPQHVAAGDMDSLVAAWLAWGRSRGLMGDGRAAEPQVRPLVIVLHGPSGVGKDSVIDALRARTGIHRATSSTSRLRRTDEEDGNHYHFLTREEFEGKREAGDFVESALVYGDWKGLERAEILGPLAEGRDVIIRTDVQGARTWREKIEGAVFIFLTAEDRDALRARLVGRGSEDETSVARRIAELEDELADIDNNDYVVVNHHLGLDQTVSEVEEIIERERHNPERPLPRLRG
ncbi:MAG: guanylate kinase [Dehalococcoidia bacterium]